MFPFLGYMGWTLHRGQIALRRIGLRHGAIHVAFGRFPDVPFRGLVCTQESS